jgi:hypothetical protein
MDLLLQALQGQFDILELLPQIINPASELLYKREKTSVLQL